MAHLHFDTPSRHIKWGVRTFTSTPDRSVFCGHSGWPTAPYLLPGFLSAECAAIFPLGFAKPEAGAPGPRRQSAASRGSTQWRRSLLFLSLRRLGTQPHPNRLPIREFDPQRFQSPHHCIDGIEAACEGFGPPFFHGAYRIEVDAAPLSKLALRQAGEHASCPQLISRL